ncbi:MAG: hypothetical protein M3444_21790, partial [Acidobacteriota bacterium]|nr:hypothetical protein [Acidobacteriota bacterium]
MTETNGRKKRSTAAKLFPALLLALLFCVNSALPARAASPSGTVGPFPGDYVHWYGKETPAAASIDESTCVEGVNCETFKLTVSGTPSEWVGKHAIVSIFWGRITSDYDLYIHKGSNTGPLVAYSAHGAADDPNNAEEVINLDPATTGTGEYSLHVVYFATTGDLY